MRRGPITVPLGSRWRSKSGLGVTARTLSMYRTYDEVVYTFDGSNRRERAAARAFLLSFRREAR